MIIEGKRIRNIDRYLLDIKEGSNFFIVLNNPNDFANALKEYGYMGDFKEPSSFVPKPLKRISDFNINGRWVKDKSLPLEERFFESSYHVVDWHGTDHYGTRYYSRMCYQLRLIEPPLIELQVADGVISSPMLTYDNTNRDVIKHTINLFLEMFGLCATTYDRHEIKADTRFKRLNWTILPKGEFPWERAQEHVAEIIKMVPERHKTIIIDRHKTITDNVPTFMAIGEQGFLGYVVYGFTEKNLYVFESNRPNNATYVFRGHWEDASKLSKAEILAGHLHEARLFHTDKWKQNIKLLIMK